MRKTINFVLTYASVAFKKRQIDLYIYMKQIGEKIHCYQLLKMSELKLQSAGVLGFEEKAISIQNVGK